MVDKSFLRQLADDLRIMKVCCDSTEAALRRLNEKSKRDRFWHEMMKGHTDNMERATQNYNWALGELRKHAELANPGRFDNVLKLYEAGVFDHFEMVNAMLDAALFPLPSGVGGVDLPTDGLS